jgi:hypothetical protein
VTGLSGRAAGSTLGFLAVVADGLKLPVLTHRLVLSALPADCARGCVVLALWSGTAAILAGGWLLATNPRPNT